MVIAGIGVLYDFDLQNPSIFLIESERTNCGINKDNTETIHMDVPLAIEAMKAYSENRKEFRCNGQNVKLAAFLPTEHYDEYCLYPKPESEIEAPINHDLLPVYLYKTTCHCYACRKKYKFDDIKSVRANVRTVSGKFRRIEVEFCKLCGKYFISEVQLAQYEIEFGTFMISRTYQKEDPEYEMSGDIFAPDSILSRHGYYVSRERNPGDRRRYEILWMLLHNGLATKAQIKEILSNFIALRNADQYRAKAIWQEDLRFLLSLDSDAIEADTYLYIRG